MTKLIKVPGIDTFKGKYSSHPRPNISTAKAEGGGKDSDLIKKGIDSRPLTSNPQSTGSTGNNQGSGNQQGVPPVPPSTPKK